MDSVTVEICCGSYYDALSAFRGGAHRIELNSALFLGGLTPSLSELILTKQNTSLKVIAMVRPRGAGFCYGPEDFEQMMMDCRLMMEHGADGIAFGCLNPDFSIQTDQTGQMISLIKSFHGEAVFHRAFDCVKDPFVSARQLISLGADRILTSGLKNTAPEGWRNLKGLNRTFGDQIEILAGSGINAGNAGDLVEKTGITQIHSSCKCWHLDPTTAADGVTYQYAGAGHDMEYEAVSEELVRALIQSVKQEEE